MSECVCLCVFVWQEMSGREVYHLFFSTVELLLVTGGCTWASLRLTQSRSISLLSVKQTQPVNRNHGAWKLFSRYSKKKETTMSMPFVLVGGHLHIFILDFHFANAY